MNKEFFYNLGLTKGETEVYLALLKIGQAPVGKIVKEAKITKSKIYDILDRLKNKGLVSNFLKNKVNYYNAAPPNFLQGLLDKKAKEIQNQKKELQELIPSLSDLQTISSKEERAEIFEGYNGLKNAFQIVENEFQPNEEFLVFGVDKTLNEQQLNFFINYHKKRVKAKLKTKVIFTTNLKGVKEYHQKQDAYNQERFLDQSSAIPINVYKDNVIIPLLGSGEKEITIFIKNKKLAKGFQEYFNTLWKISKP
ncbi:MAG: helix-turn-helix domain-containing protein [Nanoarchaeota archaeon]|nr:helix-turn-helix domain-containing protein [Nanoarchaeota archaeon]